MLPDAPLHTLTLLGRAGTRGVQAPGIVFDHHPLPASPAKGEVSHTVRGDC